MKYRNTIRSRHFTTIGTLAAAAWLLAACAALPTEPSQAEQIDSYDPSIPSVVDDLTPVIMTDQGAVRNPETGTSPQELVALIDAAAAACDHERYRRFRQALQKGAAQEAIDLRAAGKDPYEDPRLQYMDDQLRRLPQTLDCRKTRPQIAYNYSADVGLGGIRLQLPATRYLGLEMGSVPYLDRGITVDDEETTNVTRVGGTVKLGDFDWGRLDLALGYTRTRFNKEQRIDQFDPQGETLLVPGTGDGPNGAGFSLPSAGGLNVVTNLLYDLEYEQDFAYAKFQKTIPFRGGILQPYGGLSYGKLDFRQGFSGSIIGYGRDFDYLSDVEVETVSPILGVQAAFPCDDLPLAWHIGATGTVDFNDATGSDQLDFTGFSRQRVNIENDETTYSYTLNGGVTIGPRSPFNVSLDGFYGRIGNTPQISRDGVGNTRLSLEDTDIFGGMVRTRLQF